MEENFSMEWNMEENFSMEWNMEWKIFGMEWKWNGRKLLGWNKEKSSSIPYHALLGNIRIAILQTKKFLKPFLPFYAANALAIALLKCKTTTEN